MLHQLASSVGPIGGFSQRFRWILAVRRRADGQSGPSSSRRFEVSRVVHHGEGQPAHGAPGIRGFRAGYKLKNRVFFGQKAVLELQPQHQRDLHGLLDLI